MTRFLLGRVLWGAGAIALAVTVSFALLRAIPGGPFDADKALPPEVLRNLERAYGLDRPLHRQYLGYWKGVLRGDLGPSYKYRSRGVTDILRDAFPVSAALGLAAFCLAAAVGVGLGVAAALRPGGRTDRGLMALAALGVSLPSFVLGALLVYAVGLKLRWLPPARWEGPESILLPALTLAAAPAAYLARLTRGAFLDAAGQDFVRTARAKGAGPLRTAAKHVLRNALVPIVTVLGPLFAMLITGSFVVETIFALPGMGRFFITAVLNRDYPLVMGVTLTAAALVVVANLAVDVAYFVLDPRIRERYRR